MNLRDGGRGPSNIGDVSSIPASLSQKTDKLAAFYHKTKLYELGRGLIGTH